MKKSRLAMCRKMGFLLAVSIGVLLCGCDQISGLKQETETELASGKRKADITVVSIVGNELTYYEEETEAETETELATEKASEAESELATEKASEAESELATEKASEAESEAGTGNATSTETEAESGTGTAAEVTQMSDKGMPDMGQMRDGEMPDMSQFGDGEMPDMSQMENGEMPDMSQFGNGEMPDMSQFGNGEMPDMSAMFDGDSKSGSSGRMQGGRGAQRETKTVYLPVSVVVHTGTSSTATFSILEAGDELTVLYETNADGEEVITEIWMKGSSK